MTPKLHSLTECIEKKIKIDFIYKLRKYTQRSSKRNIYNDNDSTYVK